MKSSLAVCVAVIVTAEFMPALRAVTATGLSSFEAIEEPAVKFFPASGKFAPDTFVNITDRGSGTFRFANRFNAEWWDGDRDTENKDRQRAEVKGLGPYQPHGATFEYAMTWRTNPEFRGPNGFCHIFQLKAINGDSGAPLITLSLRGSKASVEANPDGPKIVARELAWKPDTWQTVRIRVKVSPRGDGELLASVDGDAFQGRTGVALSRPGANLYRPKWGLYRRAVVGGPLGDDFVEHRDVTAMPVGAPPIANAEIELQARAHAKEATPQRALAWLETQAASAARDFALASVVALWSETDPAAAMPRAAGLQPDPLREDAIARVFGRWADRDVAAAAAWLHRQPPSAAHDRLVWLFTTDTTYRYVNRKVALDALPVISNPALRAQAFEHVVEIWARTERDAAVAFVERTPALSAEQKRTLVAKLRARPGAKAK